MLSILGISSALLDAELIMAFVLGRARLEVVLDRNRILSKEQIEQFLQLLKRRLCFEPMAYILGEKEFFGLPFIVNQHCLIPRPDTECVVEACLRHLPVDCDGTVFDIATGSGAIAISLLHERPKLKVIASDISYKALEIAKQNSILNKVDHRLELLESDLFAAFADNEKASLIVCNPPYIGALEYTKLMPDVRLYEPKLALATSDELGLVFYRRLLNDAPAYLKSGAYLVMEIGYCQKPYIEKLIDHTWKSYEFLTDLAQNPRVLVLQRN